jgi:hypothetical protein
LIPCCQTLLSVLPSKKLRERIAVRPRDGSLAQLSRRPVGWRYVALVVARGALVVTRATLVGVNATLVGVRATLLVTSCRFRQKVSRK